MGDPPPAQEIELDPVRLLAWLGEDPGVQVIDVREPGEREAGHIEGTRHIPLASLTDAAGSVDRERPVVFYCRVGARSLMAAQAFRAAGFSAYSMAEASFAGRARAARSHPRAGTSPITEEDVRMNASTNYPNVRRGEGYAVGHLDDLGDGPGFRKVRKALEVTAFGVNAIVLPAGIETGFHYHDLQEELYFVHSGAIEMEFGDGSVERLEAGASRAWTPRRCARSATRASATPCTSAPAARTATSAAMAACVRARRRACASSTAPASRP